MTLTLVARVVDVTGAAQPTAKVFVVDGSGTSTAMTATTQSGVFEYTLPASLTAPTLSVGLAGFWTVTQPITITPGDPPTVTWTGKAHLNVRGAPLVSTRAGGHDITVDVVLGQLRDATASTLAAAAESNISFLLPPQQIPRFATPILKPGGSGVGLFALSNATVDPGGPLYFAERVQSPSLIAIVNPGWPIKTGTDAAQFRLHYHVFFHPTIPPGWSDDYPMAPDYLDLVSRYVIKTFPNGGKAMAYQNKADLAKSIFVFPVGDKAKGLGDIASQDAMMRFLLELNYFFQRVRGASVPRMPLGGAGLSAFSSAGGYITNIMNGKKNSRFHDKVLRYVGLFDCVGAHAAAMRQKLVAWHNKGEGNRHLRIYTQKAAWQVYEQDYPSATRTTTAGGAFELEDNGFTLLYTPLPFWQQINPTAADGGVHQIIPAWFMEHAITRSGFAPPI